MKILKDEKFIYICYYSVYKILSYRLLFKNMNVTTCRTVIVSLSLFRYATC